MEDAEERLAGLWLNCRDSFQHALEHFWALRNEDDEFHHGKWIVLSVHRAAEVFVNFVITSLDPDHPSSERFGRPDYPSLRKLLKILPSHAAWTRLSAGERLLISEFLLPLCDQRDRLMHRTASGELDVSASAMALLGLLHVVRIRTGDELRHAVWQTTSEREDVVEALNWRDFDRYSRLIEQLVSEYYPEGLIDHCPWCGAHARTFGYNCEACFSDEASKPRGDASSE
jgi:hypothetical protein